MWRSHWTQEKGDGVSFNNKGESMGNKHCECDSLEQVRKDFAKGILENTKLKHKYAKLLRVAHAINGNLSGSLCDAWNERLKELDDE